MSDANKKGDYEVGYGRPPRHTQFRPGQSGNPAGRPKNLQNLKTDLAEELGEMVTVTENGQPVRVSKQRLILKALTAKAAKGDARSADILIRLVAQHLGMEDGEAGAPLAPEDQKILDTYFKRRLANEQR
jgi:hypothetical protein